MKKMISHEHHSNVSKINSFCRNRRKENPNKSIEGQQRVQDLISLNTAEFRKKVQTLQMKLNEVKNHVRKTTDRINSLRHDLD